MTLQNLSKEVSKETGKPYTEVYPIIVAFIKVIIKQIMLHQEIKLRGLLTMQTYIRSERNISSLDSKTLVKPRRYRLKIKVSTILNKMLDAKKVF